MQLTTINLHGELAEKFGAKWILDVRSPAEAIRAIEANSPGIVKYLLDSESRGLDFAVQVNGGEVGENTLSFRRRGSTIDISPVIRGSKSQWAQIIIGVVLVVVAFYFPPAAGLMSYGIGGTTVGAIVGGIGISMVLGGVAAMIAGQPKIPGLDSGEGRQSYLFNGPATSTGQGGCVPVVYGGPILVGTTQISVGVFSEDMNPVQMADEGAFTTGSTDYNEYDPMATVTLPPNPQGRSLRTRQTARIIDLICEGEIAGPCDVDGTLLDYENRNKALLLGGTPAMNADGSTPFQRLSTAFRSGTATQAAMPGFPAAETQVSVEAEVTNGGDKWANAIERTIPSGSRNAVSITVRIPALFKYDAKGNRGGSGVHFSIVMKRPAESVWREVVGSNVLENGEIDGLIQGISLEPQVFDYRIPLEDSGAWDFRIAKESADSADVGLHQNSIIWQGYTLITDKRFTYRHSAVAGVEIDAESLPSVPDRAWRIKGRLVRIPSNYDPVTRTYTGVWDGTFAAERAWTDCPPWIFYDICTEPRFGLGRFMEEAEQDIWTLYEIGRYCDAVDSSGNFVGIPDGNGGYEPRFRCTVAFTQAAQAAKVLADLASNFRSMIYYGAGLITLAQDRPQGPKALVTNANVVDGIFTYSSTSRKARHTVATVKFNDPTDYFRLKPTQYEHIEAVNRYGWNPIEAVAIGCTSQSQAMRNAKWIPITEWAEKETVTWRSGIEGARYRPGWIVQVRDRDRTVNRMHGRLMVVGVSSVTVDAPVILDSGTYTLTVTRQDGTLADLEVTNGAGTHTVITTGDSLTGIVAGTVFILRSPTLEPQLVRILNVTELDADTFETVALQYDANKFTEVEDGIVLPDVPTSDLPTADAPEPPASITLGLDSVQTPSGTQRFLTIAWEASESDYVASYLVEYRSPSAAWRSLEVAATGLSVTPVLVTELGQHSVRVYARSSADRLSGPSEIEVIEVEEVDPPAEGAVLVVTALANAVDVVWENPDDIDFEEAELVASITSDIEDATVIFRGRSTGYAQSAMIADVEVWYWIRWRNKSGVYTSFLGPESATPFELDTGAGYGGTSATSLTIALGTQTFFTQAGKAWNPASRMRMASGADIDNFMEGQVVSYNSATGETELDVDVIGGTGTFDDWYLSVVGNLGASVEELAYVQLTANSQIFSRANAAASYAPSTITLTAEVIGLTGPFTYLWEYWSGSAWTTISGETAASLDIVPGDFSEYWRVRVTPTGQTFHDEMDVFKVTGGTNGKTAYLTNKTHTVPSNSSGVVSSWSGAFGNFIVIEGNTDVTASCTFSVLANPDGLTGASPLINATTGEYSITGAGSWSNGSLSTSVIFRAAYAGVNYDQTFILTKTKAGTDGTSILAQVTGPGQAFTRANSAVSYSPSTILLTSTLSGATATTWAWQYWNGSTWTAASGTNNAATYTVASGDFADARTYRCLINSTYTDEITLFHVTGGTNAKVAYLSNESHNVPASSAGVVSSFTGCGGEFRVVDDVTDVTTSSTFSILSNPSSLTASIGASTGVYSVTAAGSWSSGSNVTTITFRGTYGGINFDRVFSVTKSLAGAGGTNGAGYVATSTSSVALGTGSKSITTQTGLAYVVGQSVRLIYTSDPAQFFEGPITAYNSGTGSMTINSVLYAGSGTYSTWTLSVVGLSGVGAVNGGIYVASTIYYCNTLTTSIVYVGTTPYRAVNPAKDGLTTWGTPGSSSDWAAADASYKFLAAGIALIDDATIKKTLIMGDGATADAGIIRSAGATAYGTGSGYFLNPRSSGHSNAAVGRIGNPAGGQIAYNGTAVTAAGFTVGATGLTAGSGGTYIALDSSASSLQLGAAGGYYAYLDKSGLILKDTSGITQAEYGANSGNGGYISLRRDHSSTQTIELIGEIGRVSCWTLAVSTSTGIVFSSDTNLYRPAADTLKTDDALVAGGSSMSCLNAAGTDFEFQWTRGAAVDVKAVNFRVYDSGGTQRFRVDNATGFLYVAGNKVVGARGTRGSATITEVVALLDAWGAWA